MYDDCNDCMKDAPYHWCCKEDRVKKMTYVEAAVLLVNLAAVFQFKDTRFHEAIALACAALLNRSKAETHNV